MSINALLDEFKVKAATPKQQLAEYKAQGKKVIGVLPYYAPEELRALCLTLRVLQCIPVSP